MGLTKLQQKVVDSKTYNYLISAGAGSGKTKVLTERVIHLLKDEGYKLNELVILTFTELAAKEMKDRIIKAIENTGNSDLIEDLSHIDEADIKTFDSFCHDFVVKYSTYSKIGSSFNIGDKALFEMKKREILRDLLKDKYNHDDEVFKRFLGSIGAKNEDSIIDFFSNLFDTLESFIDTDNILDGYIEKYFNDEYLENLKEELKNIIKKKLIFLSNYKYETISISINEFYADLCMKFNNFAFIDDFDKLVNEVHSFKFPMQPSSRGLDEDDKALLKSIHKMFKDPFLKIQALCENDSEVVRALYYEDQDVIILIRNIMKELFLLMNEYKRTYSIYSFNDIEKETIRILENNYNVRNYYKENIKEILVDEYQDTNDIGDRIVELISNNNVLKVGDIKQSIYRFRHANPDIFKDYLNRYMNKDGGELIELRKNFRSRKEEVIDVTNNIFKNIKDYPDVDMEYLNQYLEYGNTAYDKFDDIKNKFKIIEFETKDEEGEKIDSLEFDYVAKDIYDRLNSDETVMDTSTFEERHIKAGDFLILNPANTDNYKISEALKKYNIPSKIFNTKGFMNTYEVSFVKNFLKILYLFDIGEVNSPLFNNPFVSLLKGFVFNINGDLILKYLNRKKYSSNEIALKELFNPIYKELIELKKILHEKNTYYVVSEILNKYNVYEKIMTLNNYEEREIKLNKMVNTISSLTNSMLSLSSIIEYFDYIKRIDSDIDIKQNDLENSDYVSIMTIHKSKGLEKPICYITGLNKENKINKIEFNYRYGIYLPKSNSIIHTLSKINEKIELKREKIRLLYVALTRARESLTFTFDSNLKEYNDELENAYSLQKLLLLNNNYNGYFTRINLEGIEPKMDLSDDFISSTPIIFENEYKGPKKELVEAKKASHDLYNIDGEIEKVLSFGTLMHSYFEKINFLSDVNKEIEKYNIPKEYQQNIFNFKNQSIFKTPSLREFHELEYYQETTNGIIDYLIEKDDEFIIVDFKLKNIDDPLYVDQLKTYRKYIESISDKKVTTYLYSILDNNLKFIDTSN